MVHDIDLCIFLGTCGGKSDIGRQFSGGDAISSQIDGDEWIEEEGSSTNQIYHFATNANAMSWYSPQFYFELSIKYFLSDFMCKISRSFSDRFCLKYNCNCVFRVNAKNVTLNTNDIFVGFGEYGSYQKFAYLTNKNGPILDGKKDS